MFKVSKYKLLSSIFFVFAAQFGLASTSDLNDADLFKVWGSAPYTQIETHKKLGDALLKIEGELSNSSVNEKDSPELVFQKVKAQLIIAFVSFRHGKFDQADRLFISALSVPMNKFNSEKKMELATLFDESGRFYEGSGRCDKSLKLHIKAAEFRDGKYADYYLGLVLARSGNIEQSAKWFRMVVDRLDFSYENGLLGEHEWHLHSSVAIGRYAKNLYLVSVNSSDVNEKSKAKEQFEAGFDHAQKYFLNIPPERSKSIDMGVLGFLRRYKDHLQREGSGAKISRLEAFLKQIQEKYSLDLNHLQQIYSARSKSESMHKIVKVDQVDLVKMNSLLNFKNVIFSIDGRYVSFEENGQEGVSNGN